MNTELGRKVLDYVTAHRDQFDMDHFGNPVRSCGTTACLAGWAMLLSGYKLWAFEQFTRPDGTRVFGNADEAAELLELPDSERSDDDETGEQWGLFYIFDEDEAIDRFRELVYGAEREGA